MASVLGAVGGALGSVGSTAGTAAGTIGSAAQGLGSAALQAGSSLAGAGGGGISSLLGSIGKGAMQGLKGTESVFSPGDIVSQGFGESLRDMGSSIASEITPQTAREWMDLGQGVLGDVQGMSQTGSMPEAPQPQRSTPQQQPGGFMSLLDF